MTGCVPAQRNSTAGPLYTAMVVLLAATLACGPVALGAPTATPAPTATEPPLVTQTPSAPPAATPTRSPVPAPTEYAVADEGLDHVATGERVTYAHFPPSSGPHYPVWAEWGMYADFIPPEVWVHNLEHSGVVILYNCPQRCPDLEGRLAGLLDEVPPSKWGHPKLLIFPNDQIETQIVVLAWGWQLDLHEFDRDAIVGFYARHVDSGPEDVP